MTTHAEKKFLKYSPAELYTLVADIEKYPEFLPWCQSLHILTNNEHLINAEMVIGFQLFREKFATQVKLTPKTRIDVKYLDGPFKYLKNHWIFRPGDNNGCIIDFFVDFEFKSPFMQKMMALVFTEAMKKMIYAFENRARILYKD